LLRSAIFPIRAADSRSVPNRQVTKFREEPGVESHSEVIAADPGHTASQVEWTTNMIQQREDGWIEAELRPQ